MPIQNTDRRRHRGPVRAFAAWWTAVWLYMVLGVSSPPSFAEDWPGWRGPSGDGTSREANPLIRWDGPRGDHLAWKSPVPSGHASPIVWGDRVFLAACDLQREERQLLCLHLETGELLWRRVVLHAKLESKHQLNSHASSTPATDGELIYVTFLEPQDRLVPAPNVGAARDIMPGTMVVAAYDFDGNQRWIVRPGEFVSAHGFCSCPVLFDDLVIVNGDHDGDSYLIALDRATGETRWKTSREYRTRSYVTPLIREIGGRHQMVLSGSLCVAGFDPTSGERLWKVEGPTEQFVASMVYDGERFFLAAGYPTHHVMGIVPGSPTTGRAPQVAWHAEDAKCYVPSPVLVGDRLFVADDRGTANCYDATTGERVWKARLGRHYSASLITAGGLVYFLADDGITKIVRPGPNLEVVAENPLGEFVSSSPAIAQGRLLIRGEQNLFCFARD